MTGEQLRDAIRALLESHPSIRISPAGHAAHALRYLTDKGAPLALEPDRKTFQNLWVRADSITVARLADVRHEPYAHRTFSTSKPNHNLFGEAAFKEADLVCFKIDRLWDAARIISDVAGLGGRP